MKYIAFFFILVQIIACDRENFNPNVFDNSDYSIKVGNYWQYKKTDYLRNFTDTVTFTIAQKVSSDTFRCAISYDNMHYKDTILMSANDTELFLMKPYSIYSLFGDYKFLFPFEKGDSWEVRGTYDVANVVDKFTDYEVLGTKYDHVFKIGRRYYTNTDRLVDTLWIAKGVGVIKHNVSALTQGEGYELLNYQIN